MIYMILFSIQEPNGREDIPPGINSILISRFILNIRTGFDFGDWVFSRLFDKIGSRPFDVGQVAKMMIHMASIILWDIALVAAISEWGGIWAIGEWCGIRTIGEWRGIRTIDECVVLYFLRGGTEDAVGNRGVIVIAIKIWGIRVGGGALLTTARSYGFRSVLNSVATLGPLVVRHIWGLRIACV